jgi:hypothetical protein
VVYCSKCGTLNNDIANVCSKCGAPLNAGQEGAGPYWRRRRYEGEYYRHHGRGGGITALIIGLIIIVIGLSFLYSEVYGVSIPWWPIIVIIIGVWLIARAVMGRRKI